MSTPKVAPFPHSGGCEVCREVKRCNYCGAFIAAAVRCCTNGRCRKCHCAHCTPGGDTTPGHGYGDSPVRSHFGKV